MKEVRQRLAGEVVFVSILLLISAFMLWQSYKISGFSSLSSAGAFPMAATFAMVVSGILIWFQTQRSKAAVAETGESYPALFRRQITPGIVVTFVLAVLGYAIALEPLGFVLASFLYLMIAIWLLGSRNIGKNLLASVASMVGIYVVFKTAFSVVLPQGTLLQAMVKGTPYAGWLP